MDRIIFHIDVNSAFLSWTSVENLRTGAGPDLREIPAIIGGDESSRHGVVLAKSIPAKAFGIRTGEPVAAAPEEMSEPGHGASQSQTVPGLQSPPHGIPALSDPGHRAGQHR